MGELPTIRVSGYELWDLHKVPWDPIWVRAVTRKVGWDPTEPKASQ